MEQDLRFSSEINHINENRNCVIIANGLFSKEVNFLAPLNDIPETSFNLSKTLSTYHNIHSDIFLNSNSNRISKYLNSIKQEQSFNCIFIFIIGYCSIINNIACISLEDKWYPLNNIFSNWSSSIYSICIILNCKLYKITNKEWNNNIKNEKHYKIHIKQFNNILSNFPKPLFKETNNESYKVRLQIDYLFEKEENICLFINVLSNCLKGLFYKDQFYLNILWQLRYCGYNDYLIQEDKENYIYFDIIQLLYYIKQEIRNKINDNDNNNQQQKEKEIYKQNNISISLKSFNEHNNNSFLFFKLKEQQIALNLKKEKIYYKPPELYRCYYFLIILLPLFIVTFYLQYIQ